MDKIKNQLAGVAALLGVIAAIGGGFVKYGEIQEKVNNIAEPFNPDPLVQMMGVNQKDIAVLKKTIEVLELEIEELKESNKNPLTN